MWSIIPLAELLQAFSVSELQPILQRFECSKNLELQDFFHHKVLDFEKQDRSKTFIFVKNNKIEAFFSLALNVFNTQNISNTAKKKLSATNSKDDFIACYLIGQLGKDDKSSISGKFILNTALFWLKTAHDILGSKFILVDAVNNEKVVRFYIDNGFKRTTIDEDGQTIKMVRFFKGN